MKRNHFFIPYYGNKRQEVENIYNSIKDRLTNIKNIVEPFCGSSALSYYISTLHPKKYKYFLNDNNKMLIELYNILKDDKKTENFYKSLLTKISNTTNSLLEDGNIPLTKEQYKILIKDQETDIYAYLIANKIYSIRPGLFPQEKNITVKSLESFINAPIIDFLRTEDITFTNIDALELYNQHKTNPKSFIFLDPPYLASNNDWYKSPDTNIYEYLYDNDIMKEKAFICLCLENNWIIKLLFKDKPSTTYDKKYETTKKTTTHIIILNKKPLKIKATL